MNPVFILTKNNLEMNKRCIESALAQDLPHVSVFIYDNLSTDGTQDWLQRSDKHPMVVDLSEGIDLGVSEGWNFGLDAFFNRGLPHVLVINSDTVLPPWFFSTLLSYDGPFITGVSVGTMDEIATPPPRKELAPCPDFSAFLIRKECWDKVGQFDGKMVLYASDNDYHLHAHHAGVRLMNAGTPFFHQRSSTLNNASPLEKSNIRFQADADRAEFRRKWGCNIGDTAYHALFEESNFGLTKKAVKSMREHNHL